MPGDLTTHVLDTAHCRPAAGLTIGLCSLVPFGDRDHLLRLTRTDADGRTDAQLLLGVQLNAGVYELVFLVGAYFAERGTATADPPFLDRVPVRFGIADPTAHYHVPLLASPWAYSTYRGS